MYQALQDLQKGALVLARCQKEVSCGAWPDHPGLLIRQRCDLQPIGVSGERHLLMQDVQLCRHMSHRVSSHHDALRGHPPHNAFRQALRGQYHQLSLGARLHTTFTEEVPLLGLARRGLPGRHPHVRLYLPVASLCGWQRCHSKQETLGCKESKCSESINWQPIPCGFCSLFFLQHFAAFMCCVTAISGSSIELGARGDRFWLWELSSASELHRHRDTHSTQHPDQISPWQVSFTQSLLL